MRIEAHWHNLFGRWRISHHVPVGPPSWDDCTAGPSDKGAQFINWRCDDGRIVRDEPIGGLKMAILARIAERLP